MRNILISPEQDEKLYAFFLEMADKSTLSEMQQLEQVMDIVGLGAKLSKIIRDLDSVTTYNAIRNLAGGNLKRIGAAIKNQEASTKLGI